MGQARSPLGVADLQRVAARGWRAPEEDRLGEWLLRAAGGFTGRANSALVVGDPGLPLPDAVTAVARWYADRGLTPAAMLPGVQARSADAAFAAAGWQRGGAVLVLTAPLGAPAAPAVAVELSPTPDDAWLVTYADGGTLPPAAHQVLTGAEDVVFAAVRRGPVAAAVARGVLTDGWLGVSAVEVDPGHRRQGLGTALLDALRGWAAERGAHSVYLQVTEDNAPARALYRRAGLIEQHRYWYRRLPG
ncbi:GNAT family N-acetyltransferase [Modestobacter muralis]|uniref:GNAT family N-acetyltransferase n=1 Tax=Modestobacter muralis TaxID=1608614 RepID=A0A6P0HAM4_9ACTN|nr:GNAT family N-acetyltransferase [Modestobacter muralis]NEK95008.1 GNAT family N-acetyltransferase [Modestobacter muralis]NEN51896.1 GNAT family N-acetyltransferase [Modestobacter muralis]